MVPVPDSIPCPKRFPPVAGAASRVLYVFIDESGDFNFTRGSALHYIFTALWTYGPLCIVAPLTALRYNLYATGSTLVRFHASHDGQTIRDRVFSTLNAHACYKVASIVLRKNRINPAIRAPQQFYPQFLDYLLKFVLKGEARNKYDTVVVITDTPPTEKIGKAVLGALRATVPLYLLPKVPCYVLQHPASAHGGLQAADYSSWAIARKWAGKGDIAYTKYVWPRMDKPELDVFAKGDRDYY